MGYYKTIIDGYLISIGTSGTEAITEQEYNDLYSIIASKPIAPSGYKYRLKADTLDWELVELPEPSEPEDEATETDYIDSLNTLGVDTNEKN